MFFPPSLSLESLKSDPFELWKLPSVKSRKKLNNKWVPKSRLKELKCYIAVIHGPHFSHGLQGSSSFVWPTDPHPRPRLPSTAFVLLLCCLTMFYWCFADRRVSGALVARKCALNSHCKPAQFMSISHAKYCDWGPCYLLPMLVSIALVPYLVVLAIALNTRSICRPSNHMFDTHLTWSFITGMLPDELWVR